MSIGNDDTVDLADDMGVARSSASRPDADADHDAASTSPLRSRHGTSIADRPEPASTTVDSNVPPDTTVTQPTPSDDVSGHLGVPLPSEAAASSVPAASSGSASISPAPITPATPMTPATPVTPTSPPMSPSAQSAASSSFAARSGGGSTPRARPASALVSSALATPLPKPRSNSSLQSSRPAPPSPANSRPQSQVLSSPGLSPHVSPRASIGVPTGLGLATTSPGATSGQSTPAPGGRDRAGSASSITATGRRIRPRSTLGTTSLVPPSQEAAELATVSEPMTPHTRDLDTIDPVSAPEPTIREVRESSTESDAAVDDEAADTAAAKKEPTEAEPTSTAPPILAIAATIVRRVIVRDYAYSFDDERFSGLGPNRPRSNWCEGEPEPEDPPEPPKAESERGWGGLSLGGLGWGFLRRNEAEPPAAEEEDPTDYTLASTAVTDHDNDSYWSDDDDDAASDPDPDGLYRAAYAFEPEGVNEMAVEAGDLLDVRGRGGGGEGWVVAIRLDTLEEGLVPEGYLEPVDEEDCPEGWNHLRKTRADSEERERERERAARENDDDPEEAVLIETRVESIQVAVGK